MQFTDLKEIPPRKYRTIVADPPWEYRNRKTGGSLISGAAQKYHVMSQDQIIALSVPEITERDAICFLWVPVPLLPDAFPVMDRWGFSYKTAIFWRKIMSLGLGFWFRGQVEVCLLGVKGNVKAFRCQKPNFIQSKAGRYSEKPERFWSLIAPHILQPGIELFAREERPGWDAFGDQVGPITQRRLPDA